MSCLCAYVCVCVEVEGLVVCGWVLVVGVYMYAGLVGGGCGWVCMGWVGVWVSGGNVDFNDPSLILQWSLFNLCATVLGVL